jgi:membrane protease YdiL (CAAX protease family)
MPLLQFEFVNWYMIIGLPLLLAGILAMRLAGYTPKQVGLGLVKKWWLQVLAVLTGFGWGYLEYLILKPEPLIDTFTWQQIWYPALVLLVFTGFLEEFIFRGMMQRAAVQGLGKWGLVFTAGIFAVLHIGYLSILDVLFVFVVGMFFSLVVQRTNSVWGVTLSHGLTNIALFLIFPFLIP